MSQYSGAARRITSSEIEIAATRHNWPIANLRAVMEVESRNSGFDQKKRPRILFERHVFFRDLQNLSQRRDAVAKGLAYEKWGTKPYPKTSDGNYALLSAAIEINEEAAYRAISMGMGQVLGENYQAAGFSSAKAMFEDALGSEAAQLDQMINFIYAKHLDDDLREKNWKNFARIYNGTGQIEKYAGLLDRACKKWEKISTKPREEITVADLRDAGSRTISATDQVKTAVGTITAAGATANAAMSQAGDIVQQANDLVEGVKAGAPYLELAHTYWPIFVVLIATSIAIYFAWRAWNGAHKAQMARLSDSRDAINVGRL